MATKKNFPTPPDETFVETGITDVSVVDEMRESYLEYSLSVIGGRALPDVRDGLKPVHRRILYSMSQSNLRPNGPYAKCAKVTGDTMANFHPHGDSAIYESLVRMAQDWSMGLTLVDGHGNFGSRDAGAAASRYTECRLAYAGLAMTKDIGENTVDFVPTYTNQSREPLVLPSAIPNLLVNGSQGIAVGMATNMAPHNLNEVLAAARAFIADENISLEEMMKLVPGPDLPTGAIIVGTEGIRDAYATGQGKIRMRAKTEIVEVGPRRRAIVVTELPFGVKPEEDIMEKIKNLVNAKRLQGIADVKDLSDRKNGLNITIQVKTGFDPRAVLEELYKLTKLEETFSINNVALVGQRPEILGLVSLIRYWVEHRREVLRRRTQHRKEVAEARLHIVDGLVIALAAIDEVVAVLRGSKDTETARTKLMKQFKLSEIQTSHILEMPLRRLTSLEVTKLKTEQKELKATIKDLGDILTKKGRIDQLVLEAIDEVEKEFGVPRRTTIIAEAPVYQVKTLEVTDDPCYVALSVTGVLSIYDATSPAAPKTKRGALDVLSASFPTTRHAQLLAVTNQGRALPLSIVDIPAASSASRGTPLDALLSLNTGETVLTVTPATDALVLVTKNGVLKRTTPNILVKKAATIIGLKNDDVLVGAHPLKEGDDATFDVLLVTSDAQLLRTPVSPLRAQGLSAGGVSGMALTEGAYVLTSGLVNAKGDDLDNEAVLITQVRESNNVKATKALDYPAKGRGGKGVRCHTFKKDETALSFAYIGPKASAQLLAASGTVLDMPTAFQKRDGSGKSFDAGALKAAGLRRPAAS